LRGRWLCWRALLFAGGSLLVCWLSPGAVLFTARTVLPLSRSLVPCPAVCLWFCFQEKIFPGGLPTCFLLPAALVSVGWQVSIVRFITPPRKIAPFFKSIGLASGITEQGAETFLFKMPVVGENVR
jgi:hypothetical protein